MIMYVSYNLFWFDLRNVKLVDEWEFLKRLVLNINVFICFMCYILMLKLRMVKLFCYLK